LCRYIYDNCVTFGSSGNCASVGIAVFGLEERVLYVATMLRLNNNNNNNNNNIVEYLQNFQV
jgi:hypothetical protein